MVSNKNKKIYSSIDEVEKDYFPKLFDKKKEKEKKQNNEEERLGFVGLFLKNMNNKISQT